MTNHCLVLNEIISQHATMVRTRYRPSIVWISMSRCPYRRRVPCGGIDRSIVTKYRDNTVPEPVTAHYGLYRCGDVCTAGIRRGDLASDKFIATLRVPRSSGATDRSSWALDHCDSRSKTWIILHFR